MVINHTHRISQVKNNAEYGLMSLFKAPIGLYLKVLSRLIL